MLPDPVPVVVWAVVSVRAYSQQFVDQDVGLVPEVGKLAVELGVCRAIQFAYGVAGPVNDPE
jgi:hypothetical protein